MAGYIRQDVSNNIANGNVIDADDFDNEFDALASAFSATIGHSHDGSSAQGAPITVVGPAQDVVVDTAAVTPKTDDTYDLGSASNEWKDLYIDGTANIDNLVADAGTVAGAAITTLSNTQTLTNKTINLANNTLVATSAQIAAALTDETGTGSVVFSGSPALTGVPTAPTAAVGTNTTQVATTAHVFAERTATATLTNKTLTSPVITGGTLNGITYPTVDGTAGQTLTTNGAGTLSFATVTSYTNSDVDAHLNYSTATTGQVLSYNGSDYDWITITGYTNSDVDAHLNTSTAASGEVLSWTGTDYDWIAASGGATDIDGLSDGFSNSSSLGLGANALLNNGTLGINTGVGVSALRFVGFSGSGQGNTALGNNAGYSIFGSNNTAVGRDALYGNAGLGLTGADNVGIGFQTGYDLSTGNDNFLGGYRAGTNLTTGSNNVALGNGSLDAATTGGRNIAIGQDAMGLGVATAANGDNVAIGFEALANVTTGVRNVAIGGEAMSNGDVSSVIGANVAIGYIAGLAITSGNRNVIIGDSSGGNITTGNQNVLLGALSGTSVSTGSNNIVIGTVADVSSTSVSNEISIGNTGHNRFRIPGAGIDNTSAALSGTTLSVDVGARDTYTLTTSGNTTFTFTGVPSSGQVGTFSLIITAGGTHTLIWPASVDWAGGSAPDAPASGETDIYTFMTVNGGTQWFGFLAGDAMA